MKFNKGFSVVEGILILVVVAVIGFVGYLAYTNFLAPADSTESSDYSADKSQVDTEPVKVNSSEDLDAAISELDKVSIEDDSEGTELEKATDEF